MGLAVTITMLVGIFITILTIIVDAVLGAIGGVLGYLVAKNEDQVIEN
jgi:hypothetical protein